MRKQVNAGCFVICVSTEHLQKEIFKLNSITSESRISVIEMRFTQNERYTKFAKTS